MEIFYCLIYRIPECGIFDGMFSVGEKNKRLHGSVIYTFDNIELDLCTYKCSGLFTDCRSINFKRNEDKTCWSGQCELNREEKDGEEVELVEENGWIHLQTPPEEQQDKVFVSFDLSVSLF